MSETPACPHDSARPCPRCRIGAPVSAGRSSPASTAPFPHTVEQARQRYDAALEAYTAALDALPVHDRGGWQEALRTVVRADQQHLEAAQARDAQERLRTAIAQLEGRVADLDEQRQRLSWTALRARRRLRDQRRLTELDRSRLRSEHLALDEQAADPVPPPPTLTLPHGQAARTSIEQLADTAAGALAAADLLRVTQAAQRLTAEIPEIAEWSWLIAGQLHRGTLPAELLHPGRHLAARLDLERAGGDPQQALLRAVAALNANPRVLPVAEADGVKHTLRALDAPELEELEELVRCEVCRREDRYATVTSSMRWDRHRRPGAHLWTCGPWCPGLRTQPAHRRKGR